MVKYVTTSRTLLLFAFAACASPQRSNEPAPQAGPVAARIVEGMAQVVPEYQDTTKWIREDLWVETDFDSDQNGRKDRIHVDVTRPTPTEPGTRFAVLYQASPYFAGTAGSGNGGFWDPKQELGEESPVRGKLEKPRYQANRRRISNSLVNQWVPRGFAVVHSSQPGTGLSQGCPTVGDWPERAPMKFVIDWLNGRAKGYTTPDGSEEVSATGWSTGKVGMMGTSYVGTLPVAAATTGVDGLEVIVPDAPNTSYYHYYRSNGLVRSPGGYLGEDVDVLYDFIASGDTATRAACDRVWKNGEFAKHMDRRNGDYNEFWRARDLLPHVKNIKAAVLLTHGLNDYNVMPEHSVRIYNEMKRLGKPVSLFLHQGGHGFAAPMDLLNRWFTHYLYGVDNGVENDPPVYIIPDANAPGGAPTGGRGGRPARTFASFPIPGSTMVTVRPAPGGNGVAALAYTAAAGTEKLVDDINISGPANASATQSNNRLLYASPAFTDTVHISGTPRVKLRVSVNRPAANLSVWLVALPYDSSRIGAANHVGNISLGWADLQNYKSLTRGGNYEALQPGEPLVPGRFYDVTFDLQPTDEYVKAGQRLAVMIMSSDREFTLWPRPGAELTVDLSQSSFSIPVVGGIGALHNAGMH